MNKMGGVVRRLFRPKMPSPPKPPPPVQYTRGYRERQGLQESNKVRAEQGLPPVPMPGQAREPAPAPAPAQAQAQAPSVEQAAEEIAEAVNPRDVVYAGDSADQTGRRSRRRRTRRGTMLTGGRGVTGDAPTDKKTLLGS